MRRPMSGPPPTFTHQTAQDTTARASVPSHPSPGPILRPHATSPFPSPHLMPHSSSPKDTPPPMPNLTPYPSRWASQAHFLAGSIWGYAQSANLAIGLNEPYLMPLLVRGESVKLTGRAKGPPPPANDTGA